MAGVGGNLSYAMVDIHHHLLWGLDDGATDLETSVAMAKVAAADGITHVVCSPHANEQYRYEPAVIAEKIAELQQRAGSRRAIAAEAGSADATSTCRTTTFRRRRRIRRSSASTGWATCWWRSRTMGCRSGLTETFYQLQLAGLTPILTHPERNPTLQSDQPRMVDWLRGGSAGPGDGGLCAWADGKTCGAHGARAAGEALGALSRDRCAQYDVAAADGCARRRDVVAKKYGPGLRASAVRANPLAALWASRCEPQPEPLDLYEEYQGEELVAESCWGSELTGDDRYARGRGRRRRRGAGR